MLLDAVSVVAEATERFCSAPAGATERYYHAPVLYKLLLLGPQNVRMILRNVAVTLQLVLSKP